MLTPQDVTNREFDHAVVGGYVIPVVDKFMAELAQDYAALYRENAALKSKLKVLVDKVEEYRNAEDAMHLALLTAQKTARELTDEAENKKREILEEAQTRADALLADAEEEARARRLELAEGLRSEENALLNAKRRTAEYMNTLNDAMRSYQESLTHIYDFAEPLEELPAPQAEPEPEAREAEETPEPEPEAAGGTEISVDRVAELIQRSFSSGDRSGEDAQPEPERPRIDFDNLQFGKQNPAGKNKK